MTPGLWASYLPRLSPTGGPEDLADHIASVRDNLSEPGRKVPLRAMLLASKDACEARIGEVDTACLVLTREKFTKAIAQFPDLIPKIFKSVVDSIRSWDQQLLFEMAEKGLSLEGTAGISAL